MTDEELKIALEKSPSPDRVTPEYLASRIADVEYIEPTPEQLAEGGATMTICVITLDNGYQVTGVSGCADPANYKQDIGRKISCDNAKREIWPLLGFMLREAIYLRDKPEESTKAAELPALWDAWERFRSSKEVDAAIIHAAEFNEDGSGKVAIRVNGGTEIVEVGKGFLREPGTLKEGDILLQYDDGYKSWIPNAKFFNGDYSLV